MRGKPVVVVSGWERGLLYRGPTEVAAAAAV